MSSEQANRVTVTDVNMPFLSMVRFMVKWAVASILGNPVAGERDSGLKPNTIPL